jgi:hypothetical protein
VPSLFHVELARNMKINYIICSLLAAGLVAGMAGCATEKGKEAKEAKLQAQAKITRAEAEKIALAKAPGGTIKEGEIEKEKGKLIWSFDITTPGTKDITEVNVDAMTGEVVAVDTETPGAEAKEKMAEKKGKQEEDEEKEKK